MVPVLPSQFLALVRKPDDTLATEILNTYVKLPVLWFKVQRYMFNDDGSMTQQFRSDLCSIQCPTTPATITTA